MSHLLTRIENFVGSLRVETPSVFFDPASATAFAMGRLRPLIQAGILTEEQILQVVGWVAAAPLGRFVMFRIRHDL